MTFTRWLRSVLAPRPASRARPPARRLAVELLEDRLTPSTGGLLDPTFGGGTGYALSSFTNHLDAANAVTVQSDGKIVVAGNTTASSSNTGQDFLVARYNADGSPDTSFGTAGHTATDFYKLTDSAQAVAIQSDGKILAAGWANTSKGQNFALARYNANGTLDTTFGSKGKVSTSLGGSIEAVESMAVQTNGQILVGGYEGGSGSAFFALARYNANGTLDSTFGNGGKLITNIQRANDVRSDSLVIQSDGNIVLAGTTVDPTSGQAEFVVARFNANGTADTSFGSGGEAITHVGSSSNHFGGLALQSDGKIVVSGDAFTGSTTDLCLVRYNADGTLDATFGASGNGIVTVPPPTGLTSVSARGSGVEIQLDGKIVAGGAVFNSSGGSAQQWSFGAARVNADGTVDSSYGNGGWTTVEMGYADYLQASTLQPDGRLLLAGSAQPTSNTFPTDVALIRFLESAPQIGSFTANPNPVTSGNSLTLTASNITDGNPNSTITQVTFYYFDSNGNKVVLGTGTEDSSGNWNLTFTVNLTAGTYTIYAQAEDNYGVLGDPDSLSLTVN